MKRYLVVGFLVLQIMICKVTSKAIEIVDSEEEQTVEPVEIPIKISSRDRTNNGLPVFQQGDDPLFDILNRMANISYLSSRAALNRLKEHSDRIKKFGEQIEDFIENLPTFPIPVLDDMSHSKLLS